MSGFGMIDPALPDTQKVRQQQKIIDALMKRIERGDDLGSSHFSLFRSALALQQEVAAKSERLEEALSALGSTSDELKSVYLSQERDRKILSDALEVMEEGFALFSEEQLVICNERFRNLLPDVSNKIVPGLNFLSYIELVSRSSYLNLDSWAKREGWLNMRCQMHRKPYSTFVISLTEDRWFQISDRRTSFGNIAVLQTDITSIVRQNRLEKDKLISEHLHAMQSTFDHLVLGVASFSQELTLEVHNAMFADLLLLPRRFLKRGVSLAQIIEFHQHKYITENWSDQPDLLGNLSRLKPDNNVQIRLNRSDNVTLDVQIHALPGGNYIANVRDITTEARAQSAMQQLNEHLEERVRERTAELSQANTRLKQQYDELSRAEDELRKAKELAEKANASKTRFLAAASHDLLQPISAAKLLISMLRDNQDFQVRRDYIEQLDSAFNNVETLLHDLLDMSRLESDNTELTISEFELSDVFASLQKSLNSLAVEKGLELRFTNTPHRVRSDKHYLNRILQNLIVNAIQNTSKGKILVGARQRQAQIHIEIRDTGTGIARENLERIFHEFTRVGEPKSDTGVGLGLSIVQRACRHLQHEVEVESQLGKGTLFRIKLAKASPAPRVQRVVDLVRSWESNANTSLDMLIFLIENDPDVLFATSELLQHWGASVIAVQSTAQALEQYQDLNEPPDLLVVDYQLNDQDNGIVAIESMRQAVGIELPTIMTTANDSEELLEYAETMHFSIVKKPVHPARIKELILHKMNAKTEETI